MRVILSLLFVSILPLAGIAQFNIDYGIKAGIANYVGEMGGKAENGKPWLLDMKMSQTKYSTGAYYRYRVSQRAGISAHLNYLRIAGADSLSTNSARVGRNLSFRNDIVELAARGEFYFYNVNDVGGKGRYQLDFRSYLFLGLSGFYHNPKALNGSKWESLQPLQTEGVKYSKIQAAIPFGLGFFYTYRREHRIGWEVCVRKTFTDYLDDASSFYVDKSDDSALAQQLANRHDEVVSTDEGIPGAAQYQPGGIRGNPKNKDWFLSTSVSYSKVIRGKGKFTHKKYNYLYSGKKRSRRTRAKF